MKRWASKAGLLTLAGLMCCSLSQAAKTELQYAIEVQSGFTSRVVPESYHLAKGDRFRFRMSAKSGGFVYILSRGTSGEYKVLFPDPGKIHGNNRLSKSKNVIIPEDGWFTLEGDRGVEQVMLLAATTRLPEMEFLSRLDQMSRDDVEKAIQVLRETLPEDYEYRKSTREGLTTVFVKTDERDPALLVDIFMSHR